MNMRVLLLQYNLACSDQYIIQLQVAWLKVETMGFEFFCFYD